VYSICEAYFLRELYILFFFLVSSCMVIMIMSLSMSENSCISAWISGIDGLRKSHSLGLQACSC